MVIGAFEVMGKERVKEKKKKPAKSPFSRKMDIHKTIFVQFQITDFLIA